MQSLFCANVCWGQICFNQMGTTTSYILLNAIGEYDQTDTLLPLERFRQHTGMPLLLLVYLYIATSLLTLHNESYTDQPYLKEYELFYIHC